MFSMTILAANSPFARSCAQIVSSSGEQTFLIVEGAHVLLFYRDMPSQILPRHVDSVTQNEDLPPDLK